MTAQILQRKSDETEKKPDIYTDRSKSKIYFNVFIY